MTYFVVKKHDDCIEIKLTDDIFKFYVDETDGDISIDQLQDKAIDSMIEDLKSYKSKV